MSTFATYWAWRQALPPDEKLTLLALAEGANHQAQCWPARALLERLTSLTSAGLLAALQALESKGLLRREEIAGSSAKIFLVLEHEVAAVLQPPKREVVAYEAPLGVKSLQDQAMVIWNEMASRTAQGRKEHRLSKITKLTDDMRRKLAPRLKEAGIDGWARAVLAVEANAHCRGVNDRGWRADFHYLLQAKGFSKALNGGWPPNYLEATNGGQRIGLGGRGDQRVHGLRSFDAAVRGRPAAQPGREDGGEGGGDDTPPPGGSPRPLEVGLPLGGPDRP